MKQVVTFGEIMLRLSPPGHQRLGQATRFEATYGGGEANVAAALAQLGVPAAHVTCFPDNGLGRAAAQHFRGLGVSLAHAVYQPNRRLGVYFMEVGASLRASTVLYDRTDSAFAHLTPSSFDWNTILHDAQWLHWTGITPAISAAAAQALREAIQAARRLGVSVSADVNYRRNLWQYGQRAQDVMPELVAGCDVVVCSPGDAEDLFGIVPASDAKNRFASVAEQLVQRFPRLRQVVATKRRTRNASHERIRGQLFDAQHGYLQTAAYDIAPVVDRIGGGDAFAAGFIYGLVTGRAAPAALAFATAAAALKHTVAGDVNLMSAAEVEHVAQGNTSGQLLR